MCYRQCILSAIFPGHAFILGPSRGIDIPVLSSLLPQKISPARILVYMFEAEAHKNKKKIEALKKIGLDVCIKGKGHSERDVAMTWESDYDILKYLTKEVYMALYGDKDREKISGRY